MAYCTDAECSVKRYIGLFAVSAFALSLIFFCAAGYAGISGPEDKSSPVLNFNALGFVNDEVQYKVVTLSDGDYDKNTRDITGFLQLAVKMTPPIKIVIPEGEYNLSEKVVINNGPIVISGKRGLTTINISSSLTEVYGRKPLGKYNLYSITDAFVYFDGSLKYSDSRYEIGKPIAWGDNSIILKSKHGLQVGDKIRIFVDDNEEFGSYLLGGDKVGTDTGKEFDYFYQNTYSIKKIEGDIVTLDKSVNINIDKKYAPFFRKVTYSLVSSGIENISFNFSKEKKQHHLYDLGYNAILFKNVYNGFIRNVNINNSDNAINLHNVTNCDVKNISLSSELKDVSGHHGIWLKGFTSGCIVEDIVVNTKFNHDFSVESFANNNLVGKVFGLELNFDHHRNIPFNNVFCNINTEVTSRLWLSSGRVSRGPHSGINSIFININNGETSSLVAKPKWKKFKLAASGVSRFVKMDDESYSNICGA